MAFTPDPDKIVRNLVAEAGHEGPQIVLSWDPPIGSFEEYVVYRKLGNYPAVPGDGKLMYRGRSANLADRSLIPLEIYYYTVFTKDTGGQYHYSEKSQQKSLAYVTGHFHQKFLELVPHSMIRDDRKMPMVLREEVYEATGEKFNYKETKEDKPQLWRLLKLLSLEFDRIKGLIDFLPRLLDLSKTDMDWFAHFAYLLGIEPDFTIPVPGRRSELRNLINVYKYKGTRQSLVRLASSITGQVVLIQETSRNVWTFGSFMLNTDDPLLAFHYKTPYDRGHRVGSTGWSPGAYGFEKFILFVKKGHLELATSAMLKLQERTVPQFSPANTTATYVIMKERTVAISHTGTHTVEAI